MSNLNPNLPSFKPSGNNAISAGIGKQPAVKEKKVMMESDSDSASGHANINGQNSAAHQKQVAMMSSKAVMP